jgi:hypothetical protein
MAVNKSSSEINIAKATESQNAPAPTRNSRYEACPRAVLQGGGKRRGGVGMFSIVLVIMGAEVRRGPQDAENG